MKTRFFLLIALFAMISTSTVSAQFYKRKKVAITEVVDKSGNANPSTKDSIRNMLTDAITNSEGYAGYATICFLSLEANFDRNGNISEATLAYVKTQTMDYVLVAEIITQSKTKAQLAARIINTSTGLIVASSSVEFYTTRIENLRPACNALTSKLVGAI